MPAACSTREGTLDTEDGGVASEAARRADTPAGIESGRVYLWRGADTLSIVPSAVINGLSAGDLFGSSVRGAGDIDHDGYSDFIVSAATAGVGGEVYLFRGGPVFDSTIAVTFGAPAGSTLNLSSAAI